MGWDGVGGATDPGDLGSSPHSTSSVVSSDSEPGAPILWASGPSLLTMWHDPLLGGQQHSLSSVV